MKCVIEKSTGEAVYFFGDGENIVITESGLVTEKFVAGDIKPRTHEIITASIDPPSRWGREWRWSGSEWLPGSARKGRIIERLAAIDIASIRPARAVAVGLADESDLARLEALEAEAMALRVELQTL